MTALAPEVSLATFTEIAAERAEWVDRTASFPGETLRALYDAGLYDALFADDVTLVELSRIVQAVSQGDPSAGLILVNSIHAVEKQKARGVWPERVYEAFTDALARGPVHLNSARAEPDLGAPARGGLPATTAA